MPLSYICLPISADTAYGFVLSPLTLVSSILALSPASSVSAALSIPSLKAMFISTAVSTARISTHAATPIHLLSFLFLYLRDISQFFPFFLYFSYFKNSIFPLSLLL